MARSRSPCRGESIPGLRPFLDRRGAGECAQHIDAWCVANGAGFLSEVHENWKEVLDALALPAGERQRLREASRWEGEEDAAADAAARIRAWLQKTRAAVRLRALAGAARGSPA